MKRKSLMFLCSKIYVTSSMLDYQKIWTYSTQGNKSFQFPFLRMPGDARSRNSKKMRKYWISCLTHFKNFFGFDFTGYVSITIHFRRHSTFDRTRRVFCWSMMSAFSLRIQWLQCFTALRVHTVCTIISYNLYVEDLFIIERQTLPTGSFLIFFLHYFHPHSLLMRHFRKCR